MNRADGEKRSRTLPFLLLAIGGIAMLCGARRRLRRLDFRGLSVVITGGSRGLGLEIARLFTQEGARVTLLARDADELSRAAAQLSRLGLSPLTLVCDVRNKEMVEQTVSTILEKRRSIDVLINNAGVIQVAPFENLDLFDYQESVDIHAWGPLHLSRAVAPHMQGRKRGRIVNISSIGGAVGVPHLIIPYSMGKFALTGLSEGFRAELAKDGVLVTTVIPGLMRTGSHVNAVFKGQHRKEFAWFAISGANPLLSTSAARAAHRIVEACRYGDARLIITLPAVLLHFANALFPGLVAFGTGVAARLLPPPAPACDNARHTGRQSSSRLAPSLLTKPSDSMVSVNNEE
ncbi:SDR family NAD(P)-dependent oxidoreductase [Geomonas sp. Red276]